MILVFFSIKKTTFCYIDGHPKQCILVDTIFNYRFHFGLLRGVGAAGDLARQRVTELQASWQQRVTELQASWQQRFAELQASGQQRVAELQASWLGEFSLSA